MERNSGINKYIQEIFEKEPNVRKIAKGGIIYHQGDTATAFYYLKKGNVKVVMTSPDGMEKTLSTAADGEILGEAAFFDKMPRISSAVAMTNIEVTAVNERKLLTLIRENPKLALELLSIQAARIRQLSAQIDSMAFMKADGRIAQILIQSVREINGEKTVSLTHEEIAGLIGTSRVTVSKILNRFKREGILKTDYGRLIIIDIDSLNKIING